MARLQVHCKNCQKTFDSPIQVSEAAFATTQLSNNSYQCPHCGESRTYDKADHFFE
jgi:endogenous inhibitor of DNA gyrase (YacG/DUF329 family)